jgi:hypothetical protein
MMHQIATRGVLYPCDPKHLAEMTVHSNNGAVYTTSLIDSTLYLLYEVRRFFLLLDPPTKIPPRLVGAISGDNC